jgi:hypothetical protein
MVSDVEYMLLIFITVVGNTRNVTDLIKLQTKTFLILRTKKLFC